MLDNAIKASLIIPKLVHAACLCYCERHTKRQKQINRCCVSLIRLVGWCFYGHRVDIKCVVSFIENPFCFKKNNPKRNECVIILVVLVMIEEFSVFIKRNRWNMFEEEIRNETVEYHRTKKYYCYFFKDNNLK